MYPTHILIFTILHVLNEAKNITEGYLPELSSITIDSTPIELDTQPYPDVPINCPEGLINIGDELDCYEHDHICYAQMMGDFPFKCDYYDYFQVHEDDIPIPIEGDRILAERNSLYGYYEITQPGPLFRRLINYLPQDVEEWPSCALRGQTSFGGCSFTHETYLGNCNSANVLGVCFYDGAQYNFCENFREICDSTCKCPRYNNKFLCEAREHCDECTECVEKFDAYPSPIIEFQRQNKSIYVIARNSLKIAEKDGLELYCFAENSNNVNDTVWDRLEMTELFRNGNDTRIYTTDYRHGGLYWCEYFTYPDMELVRSNEIIFEHENVHSFILNVTMNSSYYVFSPYNAIIQTRYNIQEIYNHLDYGIETFIVSLHPMLEYIISMTLRLNTYPFEDVMVVFENLQDGLESSDTFLNFTLAPADRCLMTTHSEINLAFPTTRIGGIGIADPLVLDEDGLPFRRRCLGSYVSGAFWEGLSEIPTNGNPSSITENLQDLQHSNANAGEINEMLLEVIDDIEEVIPQDVYLISQILHSIVSSNDSFDYKIFTNNINAVMRFPPDVLSKAQQELNSTDSILYSYDLALGRIANGNMAESYIYYDPIVIESDLVLAQVANIQNSPINGVAIYKTNEKIHIESLESIKSFDEVDQENLIFATYLPEDLLHALKANYTHENEMHLVTALYLNDALFDPKNSDYNATYIASIFIPNTNSFILDAVIPTYFGVTGTNRTCAFWKYGIDDQLTSIFGSWKYQNHSIDPKTHTICNFDHMTHFALLVNAPTNKVLTTVNKVASILSIIGTVVIIITAITFSKWRERDSTIVLLNYTVTVFVQHILLLLFDLFPNPNRIPCRIIGIGIHYIILVQFSWMLVISYAQYLKIVEKREAPSNIILKSVVSSWLLPLIPLAIVALVSVESYNCLITGYPFYFGLVAPISIVTSINLFVFIIILLDMFWYNVKIPKKPKDYYKVSASIMLFFLMGFTWTFGLMANFLSSLTLSYIFCVLTAFQGIIICIYFILLQKNVRNMWLQKVCRRLGKNNYNGPESFSSSQVSSSIDRNIAPKI